MWNDRPTRRCSPDHRSADFPVYPSRTKSSPAATISPERGPPSPRVPRGSPATRGHGGPRSFGCGFASRRSIADFPIRWPYDAGYPADLEVGDTAGFETCATKPVPSWQIFCTQSRICAPRAVGSAGPDKRAILPATFAWLVCGLFATSRLVAQPDPGHLAITVSAHNNGEPLPCRIHLKNPNGKAVRADKLPFFHDHFVCAGKVELGLAPGNYSYEIERGPEYLMRTGSVSVSTSATQKLDLKLERLVDLAAEGWWSGDLHVHRPLADIELLMRAENLHVAPVMTWWNAKNEWTKREPPADLLVRFDRDRFYQIMAGEDEREGGALLYFNLKSPLPIASATREYPSPMKFLSEARQHAGVWVDIEKPFWWDVPAWLASGQVDSIGLANNHMCRNQMYESEAWGKPRDTARLPPPRGNGFWTQEIYYHILNCGLRLPPSAGSASGVLPNPVGYNRVYVQAGPELTYEKWWEGLRAGRSFVSNGPMLRCKANGHWPGYVFKSDATMEIEIEAALATRDPISTIEIIKDGRVERALPFAERKRTGKLGKVKFTESGWFLVRAIADNPRTFRFASTAPFYVEIGDRPRRISRESAQFFLDWVRERMGRIKLDDPAQREEVFAYHRMTEKFWQEKVGSANSP